MCAYNYRQHKIHTIQDVESLVELVAKYGDFTSKDFNYFWRFAGQYCKIIGKKIA